MARIHTLPVVHAGENVPRPQFISAKGLPFMLLFQALGKIKWLKAPAKHSKLKGFYAGNICRNYERSRNV
jgi:hypothetical protein